MRLELFISILALSAAIIALILNFSLLTQMKRTNNQLRKAIRNISPVAFQNSETATASAQGPAYVVYNPTKNADWDSLRKYLHDAAMAASLPTPIWLETSLEDPGPGQTRQAIKAGASVVIAAGGDGTVRAVAEELAGTNIPLGLLPVGTGNLLARNLDLPLNSAKDMASIALTGNTKAVDVAWLKVDESSQNVTLVEKARKINLPLVPSGKYAFLVIGGMGFDADVMDSTNSKLKAKFGWLAYVGAGLKNLFSEKMHLEICPGDSGKHLKTDARSVMFLNCGELTGGIVLEKNADPTDSWLELTVLDTKGGIFGWIDLVRKVTAKNIGLTENAMLPLKSVLSDLDTRRVRTCSVKADSLQAVQIDGDVLGYANEFSVSLDAGALCVRVR